MAQRQFRSDDTSTWTDKYGTGSDGAYSPSTGTDAPIDSACTGTASATSLTATNASFTGGQLILIHQTRGTGAGSWELNKVASYVAGTITTSYALMNTYGSGAQVLVIKQYSTVSIAGGVTLTTKKWNGTVGGITVLLANSSVSIAGTVTGSNKGYVGGLSASNLGFKGEGTAGASTLGNTANGNAGGGGNASTNWGGGGGGGNGTAGGDTTVPADRGFGGSTSGSTDLVTATFGGAGGGAAWQNSASSPGGDGGALLFVFAPDISVTGSVPNNGQNGFSASGLNAGGGGGGAGGSTLFKGITIALGSNLVTANSSTGGAPNGQGDTGGTGGVGRIAADYLTSISGTTTPALVSRQDSSLSLPTSGGLFFSQL